MPPLQDIIDDYLGPVEEYLHYSVSAVAKSLPDVHDVVNQLWIDISRYGPGMPAFPQVSMPALGDFQVPPPPPPRPSPATSGNILNRGTTWVANHPWKATGVAAAGVGVFVSHRYLLLRPRSRTRTAATSSGERRQVVVVLGGDTPYGLFVIQDLEKNGYIVITSVSTPDVVEALEAKCTGYVKAHVLDPFDPTTVPAFVRSLTGTMSRKFPINAAGDPFATPSSMPYIQSVISLLTLPPSVPAIAAPLEHISLSEHYLPYLTATQISPIQVIQALLPLLRTGSARARDQGAKSIIVCLPATDVHVGLPFSSLQAMSAAGTLRAVEVLRREISIAGLTGKSESMKNIKVVAVDVGKFNTKEENLLPPDVLYRTIESWSASEKLTYGPGFVSLMQQTHRPARRPSGPRSIMQRIRAVFGPRRETDVSVLSNNLLRVVSNGKLGSHQFTICGINLGFGPIRNWGQGQRFATGAGARTYAFASHLPSHILDGLLNLPHFLISVRNRLLATEPYRGPPPPATPPAAPGPRRPAVQQSILQAPPPPPVDMHEAQSEHESISSISDADDLSSLSDTIGSSWVSLGHRSDDHVAHESLDA